jgi:hypothetical protein
VCKGIGGPWLSSRNKSSECAGVGLSRVRTERCQS